MKKIKILILTQILLSLIACSGSNSQLLTNLRDSVKKHVSLSSKDSSHYSILSVDSLTKFDWDKFYVFDEYVTNKQVSEITGIKWDGPYIPSGDKRILFIFKDKIVQWVDYSPISFPLFIYTCSSTEQFEFYKRDSPFAIFKSCDINGCIYAMVPLRCIEDFKEMYSKKMNQYLSKGEPQAGRLRQRRTEQSGKALFNPLMPCPLLKHATRSLFYGAGKHKSIWVNAVNYVF